MAAAVFVAAELFVRLVVIGPGVDADYWQVEAGIRFGQYRQMLDRGAPPDVLVTGDSTALHGLDPAVLASHLGSGATGHSLACAGNYQLAYAYSTLPWLRRPKPQLPRIVVTSFSWSSLRDTDRSGPERQILRAPAVSRLTGEITLIDRLGLRMARFGPFARAWLRGHDEVTATGYTPLVGQTAGWKRTLAGGGQTGKAPVANCPIVAERWRVIEDLAQTTASRQIMLVLVMPPHATPAQANDDDDVLARLRDLARRHSPQVRVLDQRRPSWCRPEFFYDSSHINHEGAKRLSEVVGQAIASPAR